MSARGRARAAGQPARRGAALLLAFVLAGCASQPALYAVPTATAARIRMVCPEGTFIGTMTANCPQIVK